LLAASAGTITEGYDWVIYSSFVAIVAPVLFFPPGDAAAASLLALATFSVAFVARPFGTVVCGQLADRYGRRPVLFGTVALMGVATAVIAAAPTYAAIGVGAPLILIIARLAQGFAYAGEWGPATLMAAEDTPAERGRRAAAVPAALYIGSILATIVLLVFTSLLSRDDLLAWGWRVPFVIGAVLAAGVLLLRSRAPETTRFEELRARGELVANPIGQVLRGYAKPVALLTLVCAANAGAFYIAIVFGQSWGIQLGYSRPQVTLLVLVASVASLIEVLVLGRLADRIGSKPLISTGLVLTIVATAVWALLFSSGVFALAAVGTVLLSLAGTFGFAVFGPLAGAQFPAAVRASGIGLAFQLSSVIGGGILPLVAATVLGGVAAGGAGTAITLYVVTPLIGLQVAGLFAMRRLNAREWA
jgi:MFS family permease